MEKRTATNIGPTGMTPKRKEHRSTDIAEAILGSSPEAEAFRPPPGLGLFPAAGSGAAASSAAGAMAPPTAPSDATLGGGAGGPYPRPVEATPSFTEQALAHLTQLVGLQQAQLAQQSELMNRILHVQAQSAQSAHVVDQPRGDGNVNLPEREHQQEHDDKSRMNDNDNAEAIAEAVKNEKLSATVMSQIKSAASKMRKKMASVAKTVEHIEKLRAQVVELRSGTVPSGMKPFSLPFECIHFQSMCVASGDEPRKVEVIINPGDTFEVAKQRIHLELLARIAEIDMEVEKLRLHELKESTSFDAFVAACETAMLEEVESLGKITDDLSSPDQLFCAKHALAKATAAKMYKQVVEGAAHARTRDLKEKEKQKERHQKVLDDAAKLKPEEVLENSVISIVKKNFYNNNKSEVVDYSAMLDISAKEPVLAVSSKGSTRRRTKKELAHDKVRQGNGQSPGDAQGHNSMTGTQKNTMYSAKGGKGKGKGINKGKHSGKNNNSKGAGKNNNSKGAGKNNNSKGVGKNNNFKGVGKRMNGTSMRDFGKGAGKGKGKWMPKGSKGGGKSKNIGYTAWQW